MHARWLPWPDVTVDTRLLPAGAGRHVRVHRLVTPGPLHAVEGGFAVPPDGAGTDAEGSGARAACGELTGSIGDLPGVRVGEVLRPDPNGHLLWPRTALPMLRGALAPGTHWLAADVRATADGGGGRPVRLDWRALPGLPGALRDGRAPDRPGPSV
ncbi:hypothetical protein FRZ03_28960 [Streptomyces misionensis]|uniref:DUF2264 domain-containing protein n=1 Tax=Streptomyces misionensis TaxID=67331 RepID=A0A5C6IYM1_9ACTN|nr:hypothetical protein [Streptomyces misionensis]TWV34199.1 hypothetical protein FRZ03_28960 [Streptomyces misionensis]